MMTDPISDMLTRIRNAIHARKEHVEIPYSKLKLEILKVIEREGYIISSRVAGEPHKEKILVNLKYRADREPAVSKLERISKPGRRTYTGYQKIKPVLGGLGISVISTSKGMMTDKEAKESKMGGEILCTVW